MCEKAHLCCRGKISILKYSDGEKKHMNKMAMTHKQDITHITTQMLNPANHSSEVP